jgi:hypothetical protein
LPLVDEAVVDAVRYQLLPLYAKEEIEICFVQVDDSVAMDFGVVKFFSEHDNGNGKPSLKWVFVCNPHVHEVNLIL